MPRRSMRACDRGDRHQAETPAHGELDDRRAGALGRPAMPRAQVAVGPAHLVVEDGRELVEIAGRRERAVGRAVLEQPPERAP